MGRKRDGGGTFADKFLYRYLSELLASMQQPTDVLQTSSPLAVLETVNETGWPRDDESGWRSGNESGNCSNCTRDDESGWSPLTQSVLIILAGALLSVVTAGANLLVILSFKVERQLQTVSNYFLFSLAVADMAIGLISIPLMTMYTAEGRWSLNYTTCQFWLSIDYLMSNASVMNLLLISFDRYFSVTRPLTYRPRRTTKKAMVMIASTYAISLVLWPPLIIAWPYFEDYEMSADTCVVQFLYTNTPVTLATIALAFYLPVAIMIVLYSRVYYVTKTRQRELVKLQAFNQYSVRKQGDDRSRGGGHAGVNRQASSVSRTDCDSNANHSAGKDGSPRAGLGRVGDAKPWGIQALLDHFSKPKPIVASPRKASLVSSGFEEDESLSLGSGDTSGMPDEAVPLRAQPQSRLASPSPSDYGSTLANQFVSHVRQSFMLRDPGRRMCRHLSLVPSKQRPRPARPAGGQPRRQTAAKQSAYDPANSPIQELRRVSAAVVRAGDDLGPDRSAYATRSEPPPCTANSDELGVVADGQPPPPPVAVDGCLPSTQSSSIYTVLIQLGGDVVVDDPGGGGGGGGGSSQSASPSLPSSLRRSAFQKSGANRPLITLKEEQQTNSHRLSPSDGGGGGGGGGGNCSLRQQVRRVSSCSAASETNSAAAAAAATGSGRCTPLIIANRGATLDTGQSPRLNKSSIVSRLSSMRSVGGASALGMAAGLGLGGNARVSVRRKRGEKRQQESKAAKTLSAILLAFILTWTPYSLIVCIESFHRKLVPESWFTISYYLCYINSTINPILYACCNPTFRRTFWRILTCRWKSAQRVYRHHHHAAAAIAAVAVAAANRRQSTAAAAVSTLL